MKIKWWYKYLVPHLLETCLFYRVRYQKFLDQFREAETKIQKQNGVNKKLKKAVYDLRREVESLRVVDPLGKSLDVARHHASQDRIRELEKTVLHLGGKL